MLRRKMIRDILNNKSQFITILLMITIGVMVFSGIEAYMDGMQYTADRFYTENNLQDINVLGSSFKTNDVEKIKDIEEVVNVEEKLVVNMTDSKNDDKSYLVSFISSNKISKFYVKDGSKFSKDKKGLWLDYFYAKENNLKVGDTLSFKYEDYTFKEKILGLIYVPDHVYDVKDVSQLMPNHKTYGFVYMSIDELEDYVKDKVKSELSEKLNKEIDDETFAKLNSDFNYLDYVPFNYIMVDVNKKSNVDTVLQVFKENPAKNLYEKVGFEIYDETNTHYKMIRKIKGE